MVVLSAIFKTPADTAAFDEHYSNVHSPLIQKVPGLKKLEVFKFSRMITPATSTLSEQPYMQCNMYFADKDTFKSAMGSEENQAAATDLSGFAAGLVSMCIGTTEEIAL